MVNAGLTMEIENVIRIDEKRSCDESMHRQDFHKEERGEHRALGLPFLAFYEGKASSALPMKGATRAPLMKRGQRW
jgi:hypothetical protein